MRWFWALLHNVIAHPLLAVAGAVERFHDWTAAKAWPDEPPANQPTRVEDLAAAVGEIASSAAGAGITIGDLQRMNAPQLIRSHSLIHREGELELRVSGSPGESTADLIRRAHRLLDGMNDRLHRPSVRFDPGLAERLTAGMTDRKVSAMIRRTIAAHDADWERHDQAAVLACRHGVAEGDFCRACEMDGER